jgi:hypothetical protein
MKAHYNYYTVQAMGLSVFPAQNDSRADIFTKHRYVCQPHVASCYTGITVDQNLAMVVLVSIQSTAG